MTPIPESQIPMEKCFVYNMDDWWPIEKLFDYLDISASTINKLNQTNFLRPFLNLFKISAFSDPSLVQFMHRNLAYLIFIFYIILMIKVYSKNKNSRCIIFA